MLKGQTPEQVPHWMQLSSFSHPGTLMISRPNPRTRSASYLIIRGSFMTGTLSSPGLCRFGRPLDWVGTASCFAEGGVVIDLTMGANSSGHAKTFATVIG